MPLWGSRYKEILGKKIIEFDGIITIEEHLADGGFGSWVLEALNSKGAINTRVKICALDRSVCGGVGSQASLNALGGLTIEAIDRYMELIQ